MFTYITNATVRVAAQLVAGTSAMVRAAMTDIEDVTVITVRDHEAALVASAFRRAGYWLDRGAPPRPPRGGTREILPLTPIVRAAPSMVMASDTERSFVEAYTPEMDSLMRRASRK